VRRIGYGIMGAGLVWVNALAFVYPDSTAARRVLDHPWQILASIALMVLGGIVAYPYKRQSRKGEQT
jgi:hypothetical protein